VRATLRIPDGLYEQLLAHLFPGDQDEHGAVILAGCRQTSDELTLLARELYIAGSDDFPPGSFGYRQISPLFVAQTAGRAAEERLIYLSCHNHPGAGKSVRFSPDDIAAHERLFPHLLDLTEAPIVGGLVFGTESVAGDLWNERRERVQLDESRVIGPRLSRIYPAPSADGHLGVPERFERQARLFGATGQHRLGQIHVGVVGAGGGGSLLVEQLARLGVGALTVVDFDRVEESNLSRIVGARAEDAKQGTPKVEVLRRLSADTDRTIDYRGIEGDIADAPVAQALLDCDFLFLATDTARARLVFNAITNQYLIPGIQIGSKVEANEDGAVEEIYVAVRPVFPPRGCLDCAGLLDPFQLHREQLTEEERAAQAYVGAPGMEQVTDPSVISLNGISASHAVTTMLLAAVGLGQAEMIEHRLFFPAEGSSFNVRVPRRESCLFCGSSTDSALARGDTRDLPVKRTSVPPAGTDTAARRRNLGPAARVRTAVLRRLSGRPATAR
jgi:molybdopterin/thiamine biosynthesis adenylyltransferase